MASTKQKTCPSCAMEVDLYAKECPVCEYEFSAHSKWVQWVAILLALIFLLTLIF